MELVGNEKKIQALFRELKLADSVLVPEFKKVWNRAQISSPGTSRVFKFSLAVAAALVVIALSSLVLWSQNWREGQSSNPAVALAPATIASTSAPRTTQPASPSMKLARMHPGVAASHGRVRSNRVGRKVQASRQPNLSAKNASVREAVAISSWQSPTAMLLQSSVDNVLTSLPQLDRSLNELKTFLPNTPQ